MTVGEVTQLCVLIATAAVTIATLKRDVIGLKHELKKLSDDYLALRLYTERKLTAIVFGYDKRLENVEQRLTKLEILNKAEDLEKVRKREQ